jgi:hypothetical protein
MRRIVFAVLVLTLVLSARTSAQLPTAQKWENVEWYSVVSWQLTGAEADEAMAIFFNQMMPVIAEVWPEMTCLRLMTGEQGITCFVPMKDGLAEMEWAVSPDLERFFSLLVEREGEATMELFETFFNAVSHSESQIALKHTGGM